MKQFPEKRVILVLGVALLGVFSTVFLVRTPSLLSAATRGLSPQESSPAAKPQEKDKTQAPREEGPKQEPGEGAVKGPKKKKKLESTKPKEKISENPADVARFTVNVNVVRLDIVATGNRGTPIPGLTEKNFRVFEDKVQQQVANFQPTEAPLTTVLLVEFNRFSWYVIYDVREITAMFFQSLRPEDWVALVAYDIRPEILADFTQERKNLYDAFRRLSLPTWTEANLFDALGDTLDRLQEVDGKKSIILLTTGRDTFSKLTYDKLLKKIQNTDVAIYPVSLGFLMREYAEARGMMSPETNLDFLQADNELKTFAQMSGGRAYFPRFEAEWGGILQDITAQLRSQYSIGYTPSNQARDGKFHKVVVELVAPEGGPLKVVDQRGKTVKVELRYRPGYYAPKD